ncbi:MAG TPA: OsmC family peroxiredoxin, partial [Chloroflexia bacterium]
MAVAERRASSVWEGNLTEGKGRVQLGSGALDEFPVTWASRTERSNGMTSPEELIAAAEAACFSMALSNDLA